MENIQNNPPADSSSMNSIVLTIVILALVALGIWYFVGRAGTPAVPSTGTETQDSLDVNVDATLPAGSGQVPAPNE